MHSDQHLGWILPGVGVQVMLHRLADTDLGAHLGFLDQVGVHHAGLRHHTTKLRPGNGWRARPQSAIQCHRPRRLTEPRRYLSDRLSTGSASSNAGF